MKFSGVTILQGVELSIFLLIFEWALQQRSATALPVMEQNWNQFLLVIKATALKQQNNIKMLSTNSKRRK